MGRSILSRFRVKGGLYFSASPAGAVYPGVCGLWACACQPVTQEDICTDYPAASTLSRSISSAFSVRSTRENNPMKVERGATCLEGSQDLRDSRLRFLNSSLSVLLAVPFTVQSCRCMLRCQFSFAYYHVASFNVQALIHNHLPGLSGGRKKGVVWLPVRYCAEATFSRKHLPAISCIGLLKTGSD
jgi:hypothetical protein